MSYLTVNLRLLRTKNNLSARQLSEELNLISENRIGDIENSMRNVKVREDELKQIAAYFNVSVEQLTQCEIDFVFIKKT